MTIPAERIDVQVFRQTMLLPLALDGPDDAAGLGGWLSRSLLHNSWLTKRRRPGGADWREVKPEWGDDSLREHVPPSRAIARAAGERETDYRRRWAYAEAAYFHPFVQRFLFGRGEALADGRRGPAPLRLFRRKDVAFMRVAMGYGVDVAVGDGRFHAFEIDLVVERCDLYLCEKPGLLCLLVEVAATSPGAIRLLRRLKGGETPGKAETARELGGAAFAQTQVQRALSLLEVQALHDGLRRLYPPFFFSLGAAKPHDLALFPGAVALLDAMGRRIAPEKNFAPQGGDGAFADGDAHTMVADLVDHGDLPVAPWWETLLWPVCLSRASQAAAPTSLVWRQIVDDRMPTLVFVAVRDVAEVKPEDLVRLCFADHPGGGLPYDGAFMRNAKFERLHAYDRFRHWGTRYFASSYSFVCVAGTGSDFPPKEHSPALDMIQEHMRRHYTHMFLLTHLQRAALLAFSRWMSDAMHRGASLRDSRYRDKLVYIRKELTEFAHRAWFTNVSNQEQGRELFALMQRHAGSQELFREVMEESALARGEIEQNAAERVQAGGIALNAILAFATILAVPIGLAQGLNSLAGATGAWALHPCTFYVGVTGAALFAIGVIALITAVQVEGRIGPVYVMRALSPRGRGRAIRRMRGMVLGALVLIFGIAIVAGLSAHGACAP